MAFRQAAFTVDRNWWTADFSCSDCVESSVEELSTSPADLPVMSAVAVTFWIVKETLAWLDRYLGPVR